VAGETLLDGLSRERSKSYMPRDHGDFACVKTDLYAPGSAIYFLMTEHEVFLGFITGKMMRKLRLGLDMYIPGRWSSLFYCHGGNVGLSSTFVLMD
jgi:hypothetical protein